MTKDDEIATDIEAASIFDQPINIEEKIDAASVGMTFHEGEPIIRNREHILRKGYVKETAAKKQFASIWNWFYQNKHRFEALSQLGPYSIYGEWCIARHGIAYTKLPDWLIAYDLYDYEKGTFLEPVLAREILDDLGFITSRLIFRGEFKGDYEDLAELAEQVSPWTDNEKQEGIYIKSFTSGIINHRFKLVRPDFERGKFWNPKTLNRNELAK